MTDNNTLPPPGGPASPAAAQPGPQHGRALLAGAAILSGSIIIAIIAGLVWAAFAPRVEYQMASLNPPTAYAVNPETNAFIAADGWYCLIAVAGGALIGLAGYFFGVRRYGPVPMVAVVAGSLAAAFITAWLGHRWSGGPGFNHVLATSKPGTILHAPISLGAHGAIAFWPLAGAAVAGGLELLGLTRVRRQPAYGAPMPGMESFGWPGQPAPVDSRSPAPDQEAAGQLSRDGDGEPGR